MDRRRRLHGRARRGGRELHDARLVAARTHGVDGDDVHFGAATWFADVLVRFGYDLPEHEHPWDGEWIDDVFEGAALDLRSTGAKLLRVLESLDAEIDAERTPLALDLVIAYLGRIVDDVTAAVPCCYGQEGRSLAGRGRRGWQAMAAELAAIDPRTACLLRPPAALLRVLEPSFATHDRSLFTVLDAAGPRPSLPRSTERLRTTSATTTTAAIDAIDEALAATCRWLDVLVASLQDAIASRADDGDDLLDRWRRPDWSVVARVTPALVRRLPSLRGAS